jgi:hypothetical protein
MVAVAMMRWLQAIRALPAGRTNLWQRAGWATAGRGHPRAASREGLARGSGRAVWQWGGEGIRALPQVCPGGRNAPGSGRQPRKRWQRGVGIRALPAGGLPVAAGRRLSVPFALRAPSRGRDACGSARMPLTPPAAPLPPSRCRRAAATGVPPAWQRADPLTPPACRGGRLPHRHPSLPRGSARMAYNQCTRRRRKHHTIMFRDATTTLGALKGAIPGAKQLLGRKLLMLALVCLVPELSARPARGVASSA